MIGGQEVLKIVSYEITRGQNFQFFHIYLLGQTMHHECFQKSFCLSNADYFGLKIYINFNLEVDDNCFRLIQQPYPIT